MTTDKELADAYRLVKVDAWGREGGASAMAFATERINKLDPPNPPWPDGTVAWVTRSDGVKHFVHRINGGWVDLLLSNGYPSRAVSNEEVVKVEPLRVLGDDEIALPVVTKVAGQLRHDADQLDASNGYGNPSAAVLRAYADALDAEAGDAK